VKAFQRGIYPSLMIPFEKLERWNEVSPTLILYSKLLRDLQKYVPTSGTILHNLSLRNRVTDDEQRSSLSCDILL
jgi:hypothetical protein